MSVIVALVFIPMFAIVALWFLWTPNEHRVSSIAYDNPADEYTIEFYPFNGKYYPKFHGYYLDHNHLTGLYTPQSGMLYAESFDKEEWAIDCLKRFREQKSKVGVVTKSVNLD